MWGTVDLDGSGGGTAGQLRYFNTVSNRWIPLSPGIALTGNGNALGGDPGTGILYYVNRASTTNNLRSINLNTGVEANVGTIGTTGLPGGTTMASTVGATFTNSGQMFLYLTLTGGAGTEWIGRVNLTTPASTTWTQVLTIGTGANPALGNSGDIYTDNSGNSWIASNTTPGSLWSIDLNPGSANYARTTRTLTLGANLALLAGVAVNPANGQTYIGAVENATGSVTFSLNTTTGAMTLLDNQTVYAPTDMGNCVAAPASPSVTKSFSPTYQPLTGSTTTLIIAIGNSNSTPIWLMDDFDDIFPTGMVVGPIPALNAGTCASSGIQTNTITATVGSGSLTFAAGGRIPAGGCSISLVVSATASLSAYTNTIATGSLTTTAGSNQATSATYKVGTDFDAEKSQCLGVCGTTTTGVITVPGGQTIQYVLSIVNSSSGGTGSATFTDTIPGLVTPVLSITANMTGGGTCSTATAVVAGATVITGTVTNALAGAVCTVNVTGLVSRTQTVATNITNTLTLAPLASTSDVNSANNTATVPAIVGASAFLTITKSNGASTVTAGSTFSYTITLANLGPAAAPGATVTDPAPGTGLSCTTVSCTATAGSICPASPFPFTNLASGVQLTPTFPAASTATFVVTCGVTATGF